MTLQEHGFRRFSQAMKKYGYHQGNSDHTLLIIYVDNMAITSDDTEEIKRF